MKVYHIDEETETRSLQLSIDKQTEPVNDDSNHLKNPFSIMV